MNKTRYIRWLLGLLVWGGIALCVLLITSIWWLPLALPTLLRWGDVEVAEVERLPTGRFRLTKLFFDSGEVSATVGVLEMPALHRYLWEVFNGELSESALVVIDQLQLELPDTDRVDAEGATSSEPPDLAAGLRQARKLLQQYGRWVPPLELGELSLYSVSGDLLFAVEDVQLRDWQLGLRLEDKRLAEEVDIQVSLRSEADWSARVRALETGVDLKVALDLTDAGADFSFSLRRADETAAGNVSFEPGQWWPVRAQFRSELLTIDSEWLPVLESVKVGEVALSAVDFVWESGRYVGAFAIAGDVTARGQSATALDGALKFSGDLERLRIDMLEISAGWGQLHLGQAVEIDLQDGSVARSAELAAKVDLSRQPFYPLAGELEASLSVAPSRSAGPNVEFECSVSDLVVGDYQIAQVEFAGGLADEVISVDTLRIQALANADSEVLVSGRVELSTQTLDLGYEVSLEPEWLQTLMGMEPLQISNSLKAGGQITGTVARPIILGNLAAFGIKWPGVAPVTVSGSYRSESWDQWEIETLVQAAGAEIEAFFDVEVEAGCVAVDLLQFTWSDPLRPTLTLEAPTRFSYQYGGAADYPESRLMIAPFRLTSPELEIEGSWDLVAGLDLHLRHVTVQRLEAWVDQELPELTIEALDLSLTALRPQVRGSLGVQLETRAVGEEAPLRVDLEAEFDKAGLVVDRVELYFADAPLLVGAITAPVSLQILESGQVFWQLFDPGELMAELSGSVTQEFAEWLFNVSGLRVREAALDLNVSGSLAAPTGRLSLQVSSLESAIEGIPAVEQLELVARAEADRVQLEHVHFTVNNSQVSGSLSLPVSGLVGAVTGTNEARREWLSHGAGRLELIDWKAEDWVDVLPSIMRRSGEISGMLDLQPGWKLSGRLSFQDFAVRPTESLPSIDLISGAVELNGRRFTVEEASALVGGSPVQFVGWLDASDATQPLWDFRVTGENVPLARTTDMILRSDLDVQLSHLQQEEVPIVGGVLNLRSSTMLVEFDPLAPKVASSQQGSPPYFSITEPSIADWRFDLQIVGDSFMRVRSPYFRTQLTANFDLGGTFSEPLLLGSVRTVAGEVRFPGATVRISSGEAYIEQSHPNVVQLNLNGIAQKASYVITMDVSQTLEDPQIHFQSTPTLSNASIVRLLTTGSLSGGGSSAVGLYLGQGLLGAGGLDDQLSDRLTVDVGEEISRSGESTVGVRYDLSEDFFLEGGYDVYDAYNLDLIWSLFRR